MNVSIELTAIDISKENAWYQQIARARNAAQSTSGRAIDFDEDAFDEDDLERPTNPDGEPEADQDEGVAEEGPVNTTTVPVPAGMYFQTMIFENDIREIYTRRHAQGRTGSRVVYRSGAPRFVKESLDEIKAKFVAARREAAASE